ncbi:hypothetical protein P872_18380 [Rhodonellum psychrophilum GCM71 = DSM 17998]|uniref:Tyr recombinase domain-containing protein n=2 Tax=Rhodonellum TaxID=336827 RepID=U5BP90_9BACT|nr:MULTISPECIES: tyrosine-type recombinase/integrase [Rhodonellum]ERM82365.1 hypothetical protein P872_18380 [Rhodonellum psychrophilum GCM71 = DSM 17998]SDZ35199.1 Site-specific recombinase XerD [Rhodonellum ikkaensis]
MKTIFFIKNASAGLNDVNSLVLRYRIHSTKKQKVKGLLIKLTKSQWNQEEQKVKRSNSSYILYNKRLNFIQEEISKLEEKNGIPNVTPENIDIIVEASLTGVQVTEVVQKKDLLISLFDQKIEIMKVDEAIGEGNIINYNSTKSSIKKLEKELNIQYTIDYLENSLQQFIRDYVNFRRKTIAESTILRDIKTINSIINWYNSENNKNIKTIILSKINFLKVEKEVVFLTLPEIKIFYQFVNDPLSYDVEFSNEDIIYIKRFLFRCFCGMRIQDMNKRNINEKSVLPIDNTKFTYFQAKGDKECSVPFVGDLYLYNLANSINFDFPEFIESREVRNYGVRETSLIRSFYGKLIKNKRSRKVITNKGVTYQSLEKCISSHTARKTFAKSIIYDSFQDIYFTSKMLGHTDVKTTQIYLGINEEQEFLKYQDLKLNI